MQYGTHDENQDNGEVNSQERSLVQDNPWKRKWNGVSAKYNETIIAIEKLKQNFWKKLQKIASLKMKICSFSQPFTPCQQHTSQYEIMFQKWHPTSC